MVCGGFPDVAGKLGWVPINVSHLFTLLFTLLHYCGQYQPNPGLALLFPAAHLSATSIACLFHKACLLGGSLLNPALDNHLLGSLKLRAMHGILNSAASQPTIV